MTGDPARSDPSAQPLGGVGLLERAVGYALGSLRAVPPDALSLPTPCRRWDLRALLDHLNDSLLALHEAAELGHVVLAAAEPSGADPVALARDLARRLVGVWSEPPRGEVSVGGTGLAAGILTTAGAVEIAVHGWDVATALGRDRPFPAPLAAELLALTPHLVGDLDRPGRFGPAVEVPAHAAPGDRLLAFLGRHPSPSSSIQFRSRLAL